MYFWKMLWYIFYKMSVILLQTRQILVRFKVVKYPSQSDIHLKWFYLFWMSELFYAFELRTQNLILCFTSGLKLTEDFTRVVWELFFFHVCYHNGSWTEFKYQWTRSLGNVWISLYSIKYEKKKKKKKMQSNL